MQCTRAAVARGFAAEGVRCVYSAASVFAKDDDKAFEARVGGRGATCIWDGSEPPLSSSVPPPSTPGSDANKGQGAGEEKPVLQGEETWCEDKRELVPHSILVSDPADLSIWGNCRLLPAVTIETDIHVETFAAPFEPQRCPAVVDLPPIVPEPPRTPELPTPISPPPPPSPFRRRSPPAPIILPSPAQTLSPPPSSPTSPPPVTNVRSSIACIFLAPSPRNLCAPAQPLAIRTHPPTPLPWPVDCTPSPLSPSTPEEPLPSTAKVSFWDWGPLTRQEIVQWPGLTYVARQSGIFP